MAANQKRTFPLCIEAGAQLYCALLLEELVQRIHASAETRARDAVAMRCASRFRKRSA
jgi:hypothetical protein